MTAPHPPGDSANDHKLIAGINAGDEQAFERLYHRHREWVFRMACRISGSEHLAQDVVQEVFRYFLGKFPGFELRCELRTFLYPAVRNLALAALRGSRRFIGGETGTAALDQLAAPDDAPSGHDDFQQIVADLSADHREILLLRFVDGMTPSLPLKPPKSPNSPVRKSSSAAACSPSTPRMTSVPASRRKSEQFAFPGCGHVPKP